MWSLLQQFSPLLSLLSFFSGARGGSNSNRRSSSGGIGASSVSSNRRSNHSSHQSSSNEDPESGEFLDAFRQGTSIQEYEDSDANHDNGHVEEHTDGGSASGSSGEYTDGRGSSGEYTDDEDFEEERRVLEENMIANPSPYHTNSLDHSAHYSNMQSLGGSLNNDRDDLIGARVVTSEQSEDDFSSYSGGRRLQLSATKPSPRRPPPAASALVQQPPHHPSTNKQPIKQLQSIAINAGYDTRGMERRDLEDIVARIRSGNNLKRSDESSRRSSVDASHRSTSHRATDQGTSASRSTKSSPSRPRSTNQTTKRSPRRNAYHHNHTGSVASAPPTPEGPTDRSRRSRKPRTIFDPS